MRKNKISAGLRRLKNAALSREKRREERKRRAALEEFRRKFDPLFIKCMTALEKDGQYIYLVEECDYRRDPNWSVRGFARKFQVELERLKLKVKLDANSETIEYRQCVTVNLIVTS